MCKNCTNSLEDLRAAPSAIFHGTEIAARLSWFVNPYFSSLGNSLVNLYISVTKTIERFQMSRSLCDFIELIILKIKFFLSEEVST